MQRRGRLPTELLEPMATDGGDGHGEESGAGGPPTKAYVCALCAFTYNCTSNGVESLQHKVKGRLRHSFITSHSHTHMYTHTAQTAHAMNTLLH